MRKKRKKIDCRSVAVKHLMNIYTKPVSSNDENSNDEKMRVAKEAISFYESQGWDWVDIVSFLLAWNASAKACPFCGRRCF